MPSILRLPCNALRLALPVRVFALLSQHVSDSLLRTDVYAQQLQRLPVSPALVSAAAVRVLSLASLHQLTAQFGAQSTSVIREDSRPTKRSIPGR